MSLHESAMDHSIFGVISNRDSLHDKSTTCTDSSVCTIDDEFSTIHSVGHCENCDDLLSLSDDFQTTTRGPQQQERNFVDDLSQHSHTPDVFESSTRSLHSARSICIQDSSLKPRTIHHIALSRNDDRADHHEGIVSVDCVAEHWDMEEYFRRKEGYLTRKQEYLRRKEEYLKRNDETGLFAPPSFLLAGTSCRNEVSNSSQSTGRASSGVGLPTSMMSRSSKSLSSRPYHFRFEPILENPIEFEDDDISLFQSDLRENDELRHDDPRYKGPQLRTVAYYSQSNRITNKRRIFYHPKSAPRSNIFEIKKDIQSSIKRTVPRRHSLEASNGLSPHHYNNAEIACKQSFMNYPDTNQEILKDLDDDPLRNMFDHFEILDSNTTRFEGKRKRPEQLSLDYSFEHRYPSLKDQNQVYSRSTMLNQHPSKRRLSLQQVSHPQSMSQPPQQQKLPNFTFSKKMQITIPTLPSNDIIHRSNVNKTYNSIADSSVEFFFYEQSQDADCMHHNLMLERQTQPKLEVDKIIPNERVDKNIFASQLAPLENSRDCVGQEDLNIQIQNPTATKMSTETTTYESSPSNRAITTFPVKLAQAIQHATTKGKSLKDDDIVVAWLPHGKSFVIVDTDRFITDVLLPVFQGSSMKYNSFIRKLNRWGFRRQAAGTSIECFYHPDFLRDYPERAEKIQSVTTKLSTHSLTRISPSTEPTNDEQSPPSLEGIHTFFALCQKRKRYSYAILTNAQNNLTKSTQKGKE